MMAILAVLSTVSWFVLSWMLIINPEYRDIVNLCFLIAFSAISAVSIREVNDEYKTTKSIKHAEAVAEAAKEILRLGQLEKKSELLQKIAKKSEENG